MKTDSQLTTTEAKHKLWILSSRAGPDTRYPISLDQCLGVPLNILSWSPQLACGSQQLLRLVRYAACALLLLSMLWLAGCTGSGPTTNTSTTATLPLTWQSLYSFALQNAQQVDINAVMIHVFAQPSDPSNKDANYRSMQLDFGFLRPSTSTGITMSTGVALQEMQVSFIDISPPSTLRIDPKYDLNASPLSSKLQEEQKAADYVQVTPMEAMRSTISLGKAYSALHGVDPFPYIVLILSPMFPNRYQVPALWSVSYLANGEELTIMLDAHTGKILDQYQN